MVRRFTPMGKGVPMKYSKNVRGKFQWNKCPENDGKVEFKQTYRTNYKMLQIQSKQDFAKSILSPIQAKIRCLSCGKKDATWRDFIDNVDEKGGSSLCTKRAKCAR